MVGFFVSHYLNEVTESSRRATVLSFKGLIFNLGYGAIGLLYTGLLATLRPGVTAEGSLGVEDQLFNQSLAWFPGHFVLTFIALCIFATLCFRRGGRAA